MLNKMKKKKKKKAFAKKKKELGNYVNRQRAWE